MASTSQSLQEDDDEDPPHPPLRPRGNEVRAYTNYNPSKDDLSEESSIVVYPKSESTRKKLEESLRKNPSFFLFGELEDDQLMAVVDVMKQVKVSEGDIVIQQGEEGDLFYVIFSGRFEATVNQFGKDSVMQVYSEEGSFGELALLYNKPRQATVKALSEGILYSLGRGWFKRIVLKSAYNKRKLFTELIDSVSIFNSLSEFEKLKISDVLSTRVFEDSQKIISQGEQADGMYFVISGSVKITKTVDQDSEVLMKEINCGGYFGELALLRKQPRAANALATGRTKVAFLDEEAFGRLILTHRLKETMITFADTYL